MLELKGIKKDYLAGENTVHALKGIDLSFRRSEFVSILGASGCGKTTLLNIIGGLHTEIIQSDLYSRVIILFRTRQYSRMLNLHLHFQEFPNQKENSVQKKLLKM